MFTITFLLLFSLVSALNFDIINLTNVTIKSDNVTDEPTSYSYSMTLDDIETGDIQPSEYFITYLIIFIYIVLLFFCLWMAFKRDNNEVEDGEELEK